MKSTSSRSTRPARETCAVHRSSGGEDRGGSGGHPAHHHHHSHGHGHHVHHHHAHVSHRESETISRKSTAARQHRAARRLSAGGSSNPKANRAGVTKEMIDARESAEAFGASDDPAATYDEYVHNLQQQVYFLELERQVLQRQQQQEEEQKLKEADAAASQDHPGGAHSAGGAGSNGAITAPGGSAGGAGGAAPGGFGSAGGAEGWHFGGSSTAEEPSAFDDIFSQFKHRYSNMERQYKAELDVARRTIESLQTQLEAHQGLVSQLKREITRQNEVHRVERQAWAEQHESTSVMLAKAERSVSNLTEDLRRQKQTYAEAEELAESKQDELNDAIAQLRSQLQESLEKNAALEEAYNTLEDKSQRTEDEVTRLTRALEESNAQIPPLRASLEEVTGERDAALTAQERAELGRKAAESATQRIETEAAALAQRIVVLEGEVQRLESSLHRVTNDAERRGMAREEADVRLLRTKQQLTHSEAARRLANDQCRAAEERATQISRELASAVAVLERQERKIQESQLRIQAVSDEHAATNGQIDELEAQLKTVRSQLEHSETRQDALAEALASESEARVKAEAELGLARRELEGKPNTEPLERVDFEALLQQNIEAAQAIEQFITDSREKDMRAKADAGLSPPRASGGASRSVRTALSASMTTTTSNRAVSSVRSSWQSGPSGAPASGSIRAPATASIPAAVPVSAPAPTPATASGPGSGPGPGPKPTQVSASGSLPQTRYTVYRSGSASAARTSVASPGSAEPLPRTSVPSPQPLADTPTRTVFRAGDARSQLLGHGGSNRPASSSSFGRRTSDGPGNK